MIKDNLENTPIISTYKRQKMNNLFTDNDSNISH
jgi:hypothetical protein